MNKTLMVVDDNRVWRETLRLLLGTICSEYQIVEAGDVAEARVTAARHTPDLIFMDVQLPDGNGLDLTREFTQERSGLAVVVCTIHNTPEYRQAAERSGASHFLPKDELRPALLRELVAEALGHSLKDA